VGSVAHEIRQGRPRPPQPDGESLADPGHHVEQTRTPRVHSGRPLLGKGRGNHGGRVEFGEGRFLRTRPYSPEEAPFRVCACGEARTVRGREGLDGASEIIVDEHAGDFGALRGGPDLEMGLWPHVVGLRVRWLREVPLEEVEESVALGGLDAGGVDQKDARVVQTLR
jgi:hypothetical protein